MYHLVANACQTLAVKFQETMRIDNNYDTIQRHVDIAFDKVCVLKMESLVLKVRSTRVSHPTELMKCIVHRINCDAAKKKEQGNKMQLETCQH